MLEKFLQHSFEIVSVNLGIALAAGPKDLVTPAGERIANQLIEARTQVLQAYLDGLSASDRSAVAAALPALRKLTRQRERSAGVVSP